MPGTGWGAGEVSAPLARQTQERCRLTVYPTHREPLTGTCICCRLWETLSAPSPEKTSPSLGPHGTQDSGCELALAGPLLGPLPQAHACHFLFPGVEGDLIRASPSSLRLHGKWPSL